MYYYALFLALKTCWATFQAKNNISSALASSALTLVSYQSHNVYTAHGHLRGRVGKYFNITTRIYSIMYNTRK